MNRNFGGRTVVLKALVGSHCQNLHTASSDEDWKFFVCPSFDDLWNGNMFSNGAETEDFDFTVHDVRKLSSLLWKANLNFVQVLFSPKFDGCGFSFSQFLRDNADRLAHMHLRSLGFATLGMHKQKMGTLNKGTATTQALVDKFGFDTKDATHAFRCLLVAQRVAEGMSVRKATWFETGTPEHTVLMAIKSGEVDKGLFLDMVDTWHEKHFLNVESFFKAQQPDEATRDELDARTKQFVKELLDMK